jgi:hypothetical protein
MLERHLGKDRRKPLPRASVNEPTADAISFIKCPPAEDI